MVKLFSADEYGDIDEAVFAAFDYCAEVGRPVVVMIDEHKVKLWPAGRMLDLDTGKADEDIDW